MVMPGGCWLLYLSGSQPVPGLRLVVATAFLGFLLTLGEVSERLRQRSQALLDSIIDGVGLKQFLKSPPEYTGVHSAGKV